MPMKQYWLCYCTPNGNKKVVTDEERAPAKKGEKKHPRVCEHCGKAMEMGPWVFESYANGRKVTQVCPLGKQEALDLEEKYQAAKKAKTHIAPKAEPMTWKRAVGIFRSYLDKRLAEYYRGEGQRPAERQQTNGSERGKAARSRKPLAPKSHTRYLSDIRVLEKEFGTCNLEDITPVEVDDFIDEQDISLQKAPATINNYIDVLQHIYKEVCLQTDVDQYRRLHAAKDKINSVQKLINPNRNEIFLEEDEYNLFLEACDPTRRSHLWLFVFIILNTGLRHADALKLKWSDFNFKTGILTAVVKGRKTVHIPIAPELRDHLLKVWEPSQKVKSINGYVIPNRIRPSECFTSHSDIGFRTARMRAAKMAREAGNEELAEKFEVLVPHMLRHTYATHFIYNNIKEKGVDGVVTMLSNILGHSNSVITKRYTHILQNYQHEAVRNNSSKMWANLKPIP